MESFADIERVRPYLHQLLAGGDRAARPGVLARGFRRLTWRAPDRV